MADELDDPALTSIVAALAGCPRAEFRDRLRRVLERSINMTTLADTSTSSRGVRAGFSTVTPYLMAPDIEPVISFAKAVLGAAETMRTPGGGGGIHVELRIGDSMVMCGGGAGTYNPVIPTRLVGLHVYVDDVDAAFQRALGARGTSLGAPEDRPYGERSGFVKDPAGNQWYIATRTEPHYLDQPPRSVTPHLYVENRPGREAATFIGFLQEAFGAEVAFRHDSPDGLVAHAVVRLQGGRIDILRRSARNCGRSSTFATTRSRLHGAGRVLPVCGGRRRTLRARGEGRRKRHARAGRPDVRRPYGHHRGSLGQ